MLQLLKLVLGEHTIQQMWYALPTKIGSFQKFLILKPSNYVILKLIKIDWSISGCWQIEEPIVCGITSLGMDHMETLGTSFLLVIKFFLPSVF